MNQKGYIALTSLIVVTALVILIGISVSALSINDLQSSFAAMRNEETLNLVEACVEDALLRLNEENFIPGSITIAGKTCSVVPTQVGSNWDFTVQADLEGYTKKIRVTASRTSTVSITSWKEAP